MKDHSRLTCGRLLASIALTLIAPLLAQAQTAPASKDDVVNLSEFTVKTGSDRGYSASETMTGVRTATQIKDLPFAVNVITSEFMEDFAVFEIGDNITGYVSSFSGLDQGGGYTLRGNTATYQLRDGFFRLGRYGTSNIDRIEIIKGPNAAVYGQSSPTGIPNFISKDPKKIQSEKASYSFGSYGTNRASVDITGPIGNSTKDFYRVILQSYERTFDVPFAGQHNKEAYLALQHVFDSSSTLTVRLEYFLSVRHAPNAALPIIIDSTVTPNKAIGYDKRLALINQNGPDENELTRGMESFSAAYEKRFNQVLSTRVGANYYRARNWTEGVPAGNTETTAGVIARGAQLGIGKIVEDGGGVQADLLAHYFLANRAVENRELITVDINDYFRYDPSYQMTGPAVTAWTPVRNMTVGQPVVYWDTPFDYSNSKQTRDNKNRLTDYGTMFRHQTTLFNDRLIAYGGVREDYLVFNQHDILNGKLSHFITKATTPNTGLNYKITQNISAYSSYSQSFNPAAQQASATNPVANQRGWGYDYGIKSSFFDDRLSFTLGDYYILRKNVSVSDIDPITGLTIQRPEGTQLFRGIEFDGTWRVDDNTSLLFSYGHINAKVTNQGLSYTAVGRSPSGVVPTQFGIAGRYEFPGMLKGFSTNLGVVSRSSTPTEAPTAGDTYNAAGQFVSSTGQWALRVPGWIVWSGAIRYNFRTGGFAKLDHTVALNVNNIFDRHYLNGRGVGEHRAYYFTYTLSH